MTFYVTTVRVLDSDGITDAFPVRHPAGDTVNDLIKTPFVTTSLDQARKVLLDNVERVNAFEPVWSGETSDIGDFSMEGQTHASVFSMMGEDFDIVFEIFSSDEDSTCWCGICESELVCIDPDNAHLHFNENSSIHNCQ